MLWRLRLRVPGLAMPLAASSWGCGKGRSRPLAVRLSQGSLFRQLSHSGPQQRPPEPPRGGVLGALIGPPFSATAGFWPNQTARGPGAVTCASSGLFALSVPRRRGNSFFPQPGAAVELPFNHGLASGPGARCRVSGSLPDSRSGCCSCLGSRVGPGLAPPLDVIFQNRAFPSFPASTDPATKFTGGGFRAGAPLPPPHPH